MRGLARWCFGHKWIVVAVWIIAVAGANAVEQSTGSSYNDNFRLPHTDSFDAVRLLQRNAPKVSGDTEHVVLGVGSGHVTDPAVRARFEALLSKLAHEPNVTTIASPYGPRGHLQIAPAGQVAFADVTFNIGANKVSGADSKLLVNTVDGASAKGVTFAVEGQIARNGGSQGDTASLMYGFIAAAVVLFVVFGSLPAMLLPLLAAGVSLGTGIAVIGLLSHAISMADFSGQLATLIGLGVGVDYALFVVTRYRQARLRGLDGESAAVEAIDTSGRAVLFAGMIVCIAMLGMFALGVSFLYGVAIAAAIAVAFTVAASLTLLPALLSVFGNLVLRRRERHAIRDGAFTVTDESRGWARWTAWMARRPAAVAVVAAALMVVIAIPFLSMRLGSADSGSDPTGSTTRVAYDLLAKGFGPGYNGPFQLVAEVSTPAQQAAYVRVFHAVASTPGMVGSTPPKLFPGVHGHAPVVLADVYPSSAPDAAATATLLHQVRGTVIPAAERRSGLHVLVAGQTAIFDDFAHVLSRKLPLFIGIVVGLSFLLLMAVFRSLLIPATAAVMNLLSAAAAFGVVTAVFQNGWGASLIGVDKTGPVEAFLPVLMFPILFGLSMDYEVFLVSRIYEEWHRRRSNRDAVAHGLAATGRTITAAAAIMVLVFGAFVLGGERVIELFGIGLASAVLLDAVIVRAVLVPAVMMVFGEANWQLPAWLERRLPRLNVEGEAARLGAAAAAAVPVAALPELAPEPAP
ncbi:MAG TPA: efflux RND transporter permease subunit [Solirubrobacteraceae bacterium]|nr:efflux RND transporter permease subunit [Solirubrobacteraceae bacterium]